MFFKSSSAAALKLRSHRILYLLLYLLLIEKLLICAVQQAGCCKSPSCPCFSALPSCTHKNSQCLQRGWAKSAGHPIQQVLQAERGGQKAILQRAAPTPATRECKALPLQKCQRSTNEPRTLKSRCQAKQNEIQPGPSGDCHPKMCQIILTLISSATKRCPYKCIANCASLKKNDKFNVVS